MYIHTYIIIPCIDAQNNEKYLNGHTTHNKDINQSKTTTDLKVW